MHLSVEMFTVLNEAEKKKGERLLKKTSFKTLPHFCFLFLCQQKNKNIVLEQEQKSRLKLPFFYLLLKRLKKRKETKKKETGCIVLK